MASEREGAVRESETTNGRTLDAGTSGADSQRQTRTRTREPASQAHSCRCGKRWGGNNTCHCGACHLTLSGITAFDAHRKDGRCLTAEQAGLITRNNRGYDVIGQPGDGHWERLREATDA